MEMEFLFGLMEKNTKDNGKKIKKMVGEFLQIKMKINMKENGLMIK